MPLASGLIHPVDLSLGGLPSTLQGIRIAHLSDLHITGPRRRYDHLIGQLTNLRLDLAVITGDLMTRGAHVKRAAEVIGRIVESLRPALGVYGVFGNHDSPELAKELEQTAVHWLGTGVTHVPDAPIQLLSIDQLGEDADDGTAMLLQGEPLEPGKLRLMLAHYPSWLSTAADLGVDLLLAGHTHGGQICLPGGLPLTNSCDLPLKMSSGVLRHRNTLIAISRGLGEVGIPGINKLRLFCPPHVPIYTLRRGTPLGRETQGLTRVLHG